MIGRALILVGLLAAPFSATAGEPVGASRQSVAENGHTGINCHCRIDGAEVPLGETACLRVDGREYTAQCAMTLNNPSWHFVRDGCRTDKISLLLPGE